MDREKNHHFFKAMQNENIIISGESNLIVTQGTNITMEQGPSTPKKPTVVVDVPKEALSLVPPKGPLNVSKVYKLVKSRRGALEKGIETLVWLRENHKTGKFNHIDGHYLWSAHFVLLSQNAVICHETALLGTLLDVHEKDPGIYSLITSDDVFFRAYRELIEEAKGEDGYIKALSGFDSCEL